MPVPIALYLLACAPQASDHTPGLVATGLAAIQESAHDMSGVVPLLVACYCKQQQCTQDEQQATRMSLVTSISERFLLYIP